MFSLSLSPSCEPNIFLGTSCTGVTKIGQVFVPVELMFQWEKQTIKKQTNKMCTVSGCRKKNDKVRQGDSERGGGSAVREQAAKVPLGRRYLSIHSPFQLIFLSSPKYAAAAGNFQRMCYSQAQIPWHVSDV